MGRYPVLRGYLCKAGGQSLLGIDWDRPRGVSLLMEAISYFWIWHHELKVAPPYMSLQCLAETREIIDVPLGIKAIQDDYWVIPPVDAVWR